MNFVTLGYLPFVIFVFYNSTIDRTMCSSFSLEITEISNDQQFVAFETTTFKQFNRFLSYIIVGKYVCWTELKFC